MKQVLSLFSKNNLIITIGIILILVSVIGLNYLKNIENLEVKKVNKNQKILEQTCHKNYCEPDSKCAYSAFVKSEKRSARGGQPEGNYGDCYISQYSLPKSENAFLGTFKYKNKNYNIPKNRKDIANKVCKDNNGVICHKYQLPKKQCNSAHTINSVGWWGRSHPKGWCGRNNEWNTWTRKGKANVHCCREEKAKGEHCGEIQTREEFMKQLNKKGINLNEKNIKSNFKFERRPFRSKIDICNRFNNNGTCSNRCLYKSGNSIYDRNCNGGTEWTFEPVEDTSDRWRIKIGNRYIGKRSRHWYSRLRSNYSLVSKSRAYTFKILKHSKFIKLQDNYGGCLTKWKGKARMNGLRGDTNCYNRGNYIRLRNNNNSYRC